MRARDIMDRETPTVTADTRLMVALSIMRTHDVRHLLVGDRDTLEGVVSNRDFRRVLDRTEPDGTLHGVWAIRIAEIMTPARDVVTADPDLPLREIAGLMVHRKVGCLPVLEGGRVIGLLTEKDVLRALLRSEPT